MLSSEIILILILIRIVPDWRMQRRLDETEVELKLQFEFLISK